MGCSTAVRQRDIPSSLTVMVGRSDEPISLQSVKDHLYVTHTKQNHLIEAWITAARAECEKRTGRTFLTKSLRYNLDRFPSGNEPIVLPAPPVQSISSIKYYDLDTVQQTWGIGNYRLDAASFPARVGPLPTVSYPSTKDLTAAVEIIYFAGHGDDEAAWRDTNSNAEAGELARVQAAICLMVGHWFRNREAVLTGSISKEIELSVDSLLAGLKVPSIY